MNSTLISQLADGTNSGYFLESGPVADQSFASGGAIGTPMLQIGGSDYTTIYTPNGKQEVTLTANADGLFDLEYAGFGQATFDASVPPVPTDAFFNELGYPNQTQAALIATNFKGIGLPYFLWYQLTNLLYKVDATFAADLICSDAVAGTCRLTQSCATYTNLWTAGWSFKLKFASSANYIVFPISALAADNAQGQCELQVEYFNDNRHSQSSNVVLGAMFL